jgi:PPIC-type PPIASE domain
MGLLVLESAEILLLRQHSHARLLRTCAILIQNDLAQCPELGLRQLSWLPAICSDNPFVLWFRKRLLRDNGSHFRPKGCIWGSVLLSGVYKLPRLLFPLLFCLSLAAQAPEADKNSDALFLRIIVVSSAEQAQQILSDLDKGANFAELAQKKSIDSTAADGGSLGKVALSSLRPELRDALVGIAPDHVLPS